MRIKGRKALLLINNFFAHELAIKQIKKEVNLTNIKVI
jgi:hypothetical protein